MFRLTLSLCQIIMPKQKNMVTLSCATWWWTTHVVDTFLFFLSFFLGGSSGECKKLGKNKKWVIYLVEVLLRTAVGVSSVMWLWHSSFCWKEWWWWRHYQTVHVSLVNRCRSLVGSTLEDLKKLWCEGPTTTSYISVALCLQAAMPFFFFFFLLSAAMPNLSAKNRVYFLITLYV